MKRIPKYVWLFLIVVVLAAGAVRIARPPVRKMKEITPPETVVSQTEGTSAAPQTDVSATVPTASEATTRDRETTTHPTTSAPTTQPTTAPTTRPTTEGWRQAYMDVLYKLYAEWENTTCSIFSLIFLDNDDIPELVVAQDTCHVNQAELFRYTGSRAESCGEYGQFGSLRYLPRKSIVIDHYGNQGVFQYDFYRFDANGMHHMGDRLVFANLYYTEYRKGKYPNDVVITQDEYEQLYSRYVPDESAVRESSDNFMHVDEENIRKIATMRVG